MGSLLGQEQRGKKKNNTGGSEELVKKINQSEDQLKSSKKKTNVIKVDQVIAIQSDPNEKYGLTGLTDEMILMLKQNHIGEEESKNNSSLIQRIMTEQSSEEDISTEKAELMTNEQFQTLSDNIPINDSDPANDYIIKKTLKQQDGEYLFLYQHRDDGKTYMIKVLPVGTQQAFDQIKKETILLRGCCEVKNLININAVYRYQNMIWQVFDYYEGITLGEVIRAKSLTSNNYELNEQFIAHIMKQLLETIKQVHLMNIFMRNITSQNILLLDNFEIRISNFQNTTLQTVENQMRTSLIQVQNFCYTAPQIIFNQKYDEKVDIWSIGIIAYEMMAGQTPYAELQDKAFIPIKQKSNPLPNIDLYNISPQFREFLESCLTPPITRKRAHELLKLPFLSQIERLSTEDQTELRDFIIKINQGEFSNQN